MSSKEELLFPGLMVQMVSLLPNRALLKVAKKHSTPSEEAIRQIGRKSDDLDDDSLESMLFGSPDPPPPQMRPMLDWAKIHLELGRPHVTRMFLWYEYKEAFSDGLGNS